MDGGLIEEREIVTPTVASLRQAAASRGATRRPYLFVLSEPDLHQLRQADVPVAACVVYAAIQAAVRAAGDVEWVTLSPRAMDALRHSFRWWWRQTEALERAGFIEVERHKGRLPRYRLAGARK